ncbi:MAG: hypothetical protein KBD83_07820 [Gammaproteobacteria bacterium]|nr:hypothetical protein [Gammaproteobacteria bacterium]
MSRVIKFRAWDEERKCFRNDEFLISTSSKGAIQVVGISIDSDAETIDEDIVLDQFTGLHDKNGKEIYEGDVVRDIVAGYVMEVIFTDYSNFGLKVRGIVDSEYDIIDPAYTKTTCELIGNIHENTELLI